ncbi:MAG TPA: hypothetical protein VMV77_18760 [Bacteroidales bacterium]|nr:hypothetical protein [Bacteroidales bacterium]
MRKFIYSLLSLIVLSSLFSSCDKTYTDLMTGEVLTGGLVAPTGSVPYKLGMTSSFDIVIDVPKGPGIESIEVQKYYKRSSDTTYSNTVSTVINIDGTNTAEAIQKSMTQTWESLREGLIMPTDPQIPTTEAVPNIADFIGDSWTFTYICTMTDGRVLTNTRTTTVAIANFFAGTYDLLLKYFHPTAGGTYPTSAYGGDRKSKIDMIPVGALDCTVWFGVWTDNKINIHIDKDYNVTITFDRPDAKMGDPENADNVCSYDPETGVIKLYYYYPGSGGPRIFWAVYTPKN